MRLLTVHAAEPNAESGTRELEFVSDGFSWPAFVFGPVWLAFHRMWRELAMLVVLVLLVVAAFAGLGADPAVTTGALLVIALGLGVAGNDLRRAALERRGFIETDVVAGATLDDCEDRWLAEAARAARDAPA